MEYLSSFTQSILELLALLVLYYLWRTKANSKNKSKNMAVPEPCGAWPLIGHLHLLGGQVPICKILGAMADKCGPIYSLKLGKHRTLIVSSWEIVKECFTTHDRILATRPSISIGRYVGYNNAIFALAPYGQYWREIRKIATTDLLSTYRLELLKHVRHSEINALVKDLKLLCAGNACNPVKVTISNLIEHFTFNINLKLIAGKRFSAREYAEQGSDAWRIERAVKEALYLSGVFVAGDALPWLEWMDFIGHVSSMKRTAKEIDHVIGSWLQEHIQRKLQGDENNVERDFMDVLLSKIPEGAEMSGHTRDTVVKATAFILIFTGAESTSVAITWVLSLLINHPTVLKAVQEELDNQVGRDKWVQDSDIKNLKYLQAVVQETMRLNPPGPVTGLREAMEDCNIAGYHIPKGTRLIVNIWKLHRDPRVWQDPDEFRPERFMSSDAKTDKGQQFEYIPFSYGRRSCPGMTAGLQLVHSTVARLLQGFDFTTIEGKPVDMQEGLGIALPKLKPLEVAITPRLNSDLYQSV